MAKLAEFEAPPVIELALDVQFRPIPELHGLRLASLRQTWQEELPRLEEHPPLLPTIEGAEGFPGIQLLTGPPLSRYWFLNKEGTELVQLQTDRLAVNWRATDGAVYPRYAPLRSLFERRLVQLAQFLSDEGLPQLEIIQAELSYVNAVEVPFEDRGHIGLLLRGWAGVPDHHLGEPSEARVSFSFDVPDLGQPPVRLYVAVNPAELPGGTSGLFLNLTFRGNPGSTQVDEALSFIDRGHEHVVTSFDELTTYALHDRWGKRQ